MDQGYAWLAVATENDAWLQFAQVKLQGRGYIGQQVDSDIARMAKLIFDPNPNTRGWAKLARRVMELNGLLDPPGKKKGKSKAVVKEDSQKLRTAVEQRKNLKPA